MPSVSSAQARGSSTESGAVPSFNDDQIRAGVWRCNAVGLVLAAFPLTVSVVSALGLATVGMLVQGLMYYVAILWLVVTGLGRYGAPALAMALVAVLLPIGVHLALYRDDIATEFVHIAIAIVGGWALRKQVLRVPWRTAFYITAVVVISLITLEGIAGLQLQVNRTYWTLPILALWFPLAVQDAVLKRSIAAGPLLVVATIGVLSYSRSVMVASAAAIAVMTWQRMRSARIGELWLPVLVALGLIVAVVMPDAMQWLGGSGAVDRFATRGFETNRYVIWSMYYERLDGLAWLVGPDIEVRRGIAMAMFGSQANSLHNIGLQLHSIGGVVPVSAIMYGGVVTMMFLRHWTGRAFHPFVLVFMAKAMMDVVAFPQRFDVVYFSTFFAIIEVRRLAGDRSKVDAGRPSPVAVGSATEYAC